MATQPTADRGRADSDSDSPDPDDLDPELLKLSKPRTHVGWLLSLSVVVLCVYWGLRLRSDLRFSREADDAPAALASVDQAADSESDAFVSIAAVPDRARAARVSFSAQDGSHVAPALGSGGRLWILTAASPYGTDPSGGEVYTGRLKRLGEMPFYEPLARFFAERAPVSEPVEPEAAVTAIREGAGEVASMHGDPVPVAAGVEVEVLRRAVGSARIIAAADPRGHADELAWRTALTRAGILPAGAQPITGTERSWTYEVAAPEGLGALAARLEESGLFGAQVIPVEQALTARWDALAVRKGELHVGEHVIPLAEISAVAIAHRPPVPEGAVVIVTTERPADYWYILPLLVLFALFALLFGWTLLRALRGSTPPTAPRGNR
jgi:hypothetical protein